MELRSAIELTPRRAGLALSVALHAAAIAAVLSHAPTRAAIATAVPIMVSLLPSEPVAQPQTLPKPLPVRPKLEPRPSMPIEPLPLVAAPAEVPAQFSAPTPPARDLPPIAAARQVATAAPAAAPALLLPRFDAAYLQNPPPVYPALARRLGEQGRALLRVLVTTDGLAERVELKSTSGAERLDRAALDAVKRWRFIPARQGDQAVSAWVVVPISFSLEG